MIIVCGATAFVTEDCLLSMMTRSSQIELTKPENDCSAGDVVANAGATGGGTVIGAITGEDVAAMRCAFGDAGASCVCAGSNVRGARANRCVAKTTPPIATIRKAAMIYAMTRAGLSIGANRITAMRKVTSLLPRLRTQ